MTEVTLFSADSTGAVAPPAYWNTLPADLASDLWFQQSGTFINGPTDAQASIDIPLTSGAYIYSIYGAAQINSMAYDGINLFFNGSSTPSISAFGPTQAGLTPSTFAADSATTIGQTNNNTTPGAGTLTYSQGGTTVTLTGFTWADPSVYNIDNVSGFSTTPSGTDNFVGSLTLNVIPPNTATVPEPSSFALLGLAAPVLGLIVCRARRNAHASA